MRNKRILIFSLTYYPFVGGDGVAVKEITDRLALDGYFFDMVTLRFSDDLPKKEKVGNVTVHRVGFSLEGATYKDTFKFPLTLNKYLFPFLAFFKAKGLHRESNYDAVWSIMANYAGFGALFFNFSMPNVPFVLTLQEGDPIPYIKRRVGVFYPLFKKIFKRAYIVQAISKYLAEFAKDMGHRGDVRVIPNAVDLRVFGKEVSDKRKKSLRSQLKIAEGDKIIITSSRLVKKNGVGDIISALALLPKNYVLMIAGDGPLESDLRKLAKRLEVNKRVSFVGHISHEELALALSISDVFVRPSISEGFGNSFIEAMAASVPVVGTEVGGIPDFLVDPGSKLGKITPTGLFAKPKDPQSIADAILRLSKDEKLREKIVENGKKLVSEKYDWDLISKDMKKHVFDKVIRMG